MNELEKKQIVQADAKHAFCDALEIDPKDVCQIDIIISAFEPIEILIHKKMTLEQYEKIDQILKNGTKRTTE